MDLEDKKYIDCGILGCEKELLDDNLNEAFEPWKAEAWLAGERKENVSRMNPDNMMAYNNYLDNAAYQALRNNDRVKAMKCVNLMRQILIAARNRGFYSTADRVEQIINHRRSEIDRISELINLNNQKQEPVKRGLFNPEPVEEAIMNTKQVTDCSWADTCLLAKNKPILRKNGNNEIEYCVPDKDSNLFAIKDRDNNLQAIYNRYPETKKLTLYIPESINKIEDDLNEEVEIHDTLNPILWNSDNTLKPEVEAKVKEVAQTFVDILTENGIKIKVMDIYLVGSNVNYNYNESSDIDIHIIADESFDCDEQHLPLLYNAYKTLFNRKFDISFKGINVEVYVENEKDLSNVSTGVYSITKGWIKEPNRADIPEIDQESVGQGLNEWIQKYQEITASPTIEEIDKFIDDIYNIRINSMANEGEFGTGNLIFKEVRRNGILDNLKELKAELQSKELSLESLDESFTELIDKLYLNS